MMYRMFAACCLVAAFSSCAKSELEPHAQGATLTLELDVPASQEVVSRALEDESQVRTLDVLFFNSAGSNSANPVYTERRHLNYVITVELGRLRAVIKDLPLGTYRVLAVANAEATLFDGLTVGTTLSVAKSSLVNAKSGTMPEANFLMAGESTKNEVITDGAQVLSTISLVRAVARVDVMCDLKNNLTGAKFELTSAEVRNVRDQGFVFGQSLLSDKNLASFPATAAVVDYVRPEVTADHPTYANGSGHILSQLYTYENTSADAQLNRDQTTCLIVGGKFNGSSINTYYRIDLSNSNKKHVVKRNHRYVISITSVLGPGYGTKDEAENGLMNNIKAEIMEWVEGGSSGIVMEGNKMLSVSKTLFEAEMYSLGTTFKLGVSTKNLSLDDFVIDQDAASTQWLTVDNSDAFVTSGDNVYDKTVGLRITQNNPDKNARTATLKLSAGGSMYLLVKVVQGNSDRIMLSYTEPELTSEAREAYKIDFSFVDPNQNHHTTGLRWEVESLNTDWLTIHPDTDTTRTSGIGGGSVYVDVAAFPTLGYSRRGTVRLTVTETDETGHEKYYYRTIQLVQFNINTSLEAVMIEGVAQRSLKIPDEGYATELKMTVRSRTAITLQKDGLPSQWKVDMRYTNEGIYTLTFKAVPVTDRAKAMPDSLDTYRIGYINFLSNKGKILRTMLLYQGYVVAFPHTAYIDPAKNVATLAMYNNSHAWGLTPRDLDKPLFYELVAHGQRVWLDRNVNAQVQSNNAEQVPTTSGAPWPSWTTTSGDQQLAAVGSIFLPTKNLIYADNNFEIDQARRSQGPCPAGFRLPQKADIAYLNPYYTQVDDYPGKRILWYCPGSGSNLNMYTIGFEPKKPSLEQPSAHVVVGSSTLAFATSSTGSTGLPGFARCISEK